MDGKRRPSCGATRLANQWKLPARDETFYRLFAITLSMRLKYSEYVWDVDAVLDALFSVPGIFGCGCRDVRTGITYLRSLSLSIGVNGHDKCSVGVCESSIQCVLEQDTTRALVRKSTHEHQSATDTHGNVRIVEIKRDRSSHPPVLHVRGAQSEPECAISAIPRDSMKMNGRAVYALADTGARLSTVN